MFIDILEASSWRALLSFKSFIVIYDVKSNIPAGTWYCVLYTAFIHRRNCGRRAQLARMYTFTEPLFLLARSLFIWCEPCVLNIGLSYVYMTGVYLVLFYNCSYVLFVRRQRRRWHHQILATVMFGLSAAHLGLNINSLFQSGPYLSLARFLLYITSKWVNTIYWKCSDEWMSEAPFYLISL